MTPNLNQITNFELKRYISKNRNNQEVFHAALQVLISRRDPNPPRYPYPFDLEHPEIEVEAILREKLNQVE
jgi:hypothetical protein